MRDHLGHGFFILLTIVSITGATESPAPEEPTSKREAQIRLGYEVFFDAGVLSRDGTMSCAFCHKPDRKYGWSDGRKIAIGGRPANGQIPGLLGVRRTKSLIGLASQEDRPLNWDGRAYGIHRQCFQAVADPLVLAHNSIGDMVARCNSRPRYRYLASIAYNKNGVDERELRDCITEFIKTIRWDDLPMDRLAQGKKTALPETAIRGWDVFQEHCVKCHIPERDWRDDTYHNVGISIRSGGRTDRLRGAITGRPEDNYTVRTPGLRGVSLHPPYMHDGSLEDLEDVVDYFAFGGRFKNKGAGEELRDTRIDPHVAEISIPDAKDRADLTAFLELATQEHDSYPDYPNPHIKREERAP